MKSFKELLEVKKYKTDELLKIFNYDIEVTKVINGTSIILSDKKKNVIGIFKTHKELNKELNNMI